MDVNTTMCGFVGIVHWNAEPVSSAELDAMIGRLRHRGPDALCAAFPSLGVGLAHARLKVIDLSEHARQPMANDEGTVWLMYNGELYNFLDLRLELEMHGVRFRSRSDTEVVLRAYELWGLDMFRRLDGMFALALWDDKHKQLVLGRDRIGKKPLFYWSNGHCVVFGSEIKALLAHRHVPCEVHEQALPFLLTFGYAPTGETCYQEIRQIPPASFMTIRKGEVDPTPREYWDLILQPTPRRVTADEVARELRRLLTLAVRRRLMADVPLGAFLSGGVDSTIVVGLMSEAMSGRPVKTFSIGFDGDAGFDETRYAALAAKQFQTEHTVFTVGPQSFDLLERLVWHHDQPFGDSSAVPTYLLSRLTREHVTVALAGDGGDELFGGYDRFQAALWAERLPRHVFRAMDRLLCTVSAPHGRSFVARAKRFTDGARFDLPTRYLRWVSYLPDAHAWLHSTRPSSVGSAKAVPPTIDTLWRRSADWSTLSRLLYVNFKEYLPNDLMVKTDRCSMAHGLEVRAPLLDTSVIEYVATLPDRLKGSGHQQKVLLKDACRDLLPPTIRHRRKMGFGVPLGTWFRRQWRDPLQDYLGSSQSRIARYVQITRVHTLIEEHLRGRRDAGHQLWLLLTCEVWLRQLEQPAPWLHESYPVMQLSSTSVPSNSGTVR